MTRPAFKGVIKLDIRDSKPDWAPFTLPKARAGAPNILIVLYDDTGLAQYLDLEKLAAAALAAD